MTRETYSLSCTAPGCRWARLMLPTLGAALESARLHAGPGHVVSVSVETRRELGRLGLTTEQWVNGRLGGYVKLAIPDRRQADAELDAEGYSQREIGRVLGVDEITVRRDMETATNVAPAFQNTTPNDASEEQLAAKAAPSPRDALAALAAEGYSQREIGRVLGVDEGTIRHDLQSAENSAQPTEDSAPSKPSGEETAENSAPSPIDAMAALAADEEIHRHEHMWHVFSFEASSQTVGYRCRGCGAERFERPEAREREER